MRVCSTFHFGAAHYLPHHSGKCKNLHGHTWRLDVEIEGDIGDDGFVIDFQRLKAIINSKIIKKLDHQCLNQVGFDNPTCEILASWIFSNLQGIPEDFPSLRGCTVSRVRVYESPDCYAEVSTEYIL